MTEAEIKSAIADVLHRIAPEVDVGSIPPGADLREALDIDSFDFLNFLIGLHQKLGVDIPEADYGTLRTMDALLAYLSART